MKESNTLNNNKTDTSENFDSKFRPVSAANKRPDFMLKKQKTMTK